jgi:hypothetical protein
MKALFLHGWQSAPGGVPPTFLKDHGHKEFDITGRAMKGWVLVGPAGVEGDDPLAGWIQRAMKFVRTLPAKGE